MKTAHEIVNAVGRPCPVDQPILLGDPTRVGGGAVILRCLANVARCHAVQRQGQERRSDASEVALYFLARLVLTDRTSSHGEHGTGVERLDDSHDGHAGFGLARDDRAMDRCGAAIARQ